MTAPVVEVAGLSKRYGERLAVADVSFRVEPGEIFGLLGPNGAGKTTSVECVQGLRRRASGHVRVLGLDPATETQQVRRRIGAQLQDAALPDRIKVAEALELFASLSPDTPPWEPLLDEWGLAGHRRSAFRSLSGGQKQRLFIALALVNRPEVVFLDELTTGLDPQARRLAWGLVERVRDEGATVVLVTHFMDEAERLCDRLAVVAGGRVVAEGTPGELVAQATPGIVVRFTVPHDDHHRVPDLTGVPHVTSVERRRDEVVVSGDGPVLAHVGHALVAAGLDPVDLRAEQPTLEQAYLTLVDGRGDDQ